MKNLLILLLLSSAIDVAAQDIIVKNDKSELKTKVLEIEADNVKYKLFDFLDGPTYNLKKQQVFMIIYQNGKRETFERAEVDRTKSTINAQSMGHNASEQPGTDLAPVSPDVEADSIPDNRVSYEPFRVMFNVPSTDEYTTAFSFDVTLERSLVRNFLNLGMSYTWTNISSDYQGMTYGSTTDMHTFGFYMSAYLPINKLIKAKNKSSGLFPYFRVGSAYSFFNTETYANAPLPYSRESTSGESFGFIYGAGLDWFISNGFGLSVYAGQFNSLWWGISLKV